MTILGLLSGPRRAGGGGDESVPALKRRLRDAVLDYRSALDAPGGLDCGANLAAVIRPDVGALARRANDLARRLQRLDPDFPASWAPYPEGK